MTCSPACKQAMKRRRRHHPRPDRWRAYDTAVAHGLDPVERVVALAWLAARVEMNTTQLVHAVRCCIGKRRQGQGEALRVRAWMHWTAAADRPIWVYGCRLCGWHHIGRSWFEDDPQREATNTRFARLIAASGRLPELAAVLGRAPRVSRAELAQRFLHADNGHVRWR